MLYMIKNVELSLYFLFQISINDMIGKMNEIKESTKSTRVLIIELSIMLIIKYFLVTL